MKTKRKTWYLQKKDIVYVEENHDGRYGAKGEKRLPKRKPTPEDIQRVNRWNKSKRARLRMMEYFSPGDLWATYTYKPENRPPDMATAMQICREYKNNGDRAKETQKKIAPYGFSAGGDGVFDYTFEVFCSGVTFRSATKKKKIQMKYGHLIIELLNIYDPYSSEFDLTEEKIDMSESDISECCQQAAENTDERQQDLEQNEGSPLPEVRNLAPEAWPDELKDLPIPTLEKVLRYLQKEEKNLEEMQAVAAEESGFPVNVLEKAQMNVAGLRLLRNLISTCLDSGEKDKEETPEQPPLPVMKNNDQRKEWLRNYKEWGIWYKDEHIGATFYKCSLWTVYPGSGRFCT